MFKYYCCASGAHYFSLKRKKQLFFRCGFDSLCSLLCMQNGRDDSLLSSTLMTPPRSSTFLDTGFHKDVFGAISGTSERQQTLSFYFRVYFFLFSVSNISLLFLTASPHAASTPNINSVRHADSRGSLISTDSGNSLHERSNDKGNSLDKVYDRN